MRALPPFSQIPLSRTRVVIPLIPHHRCHRRQVFEQHISTGEVTALPLAQVESQGTTFAATDPMELAGHAPLVRPIRWGGDPPYWGWTPWDGL